MAWAIASLTASPAVRTAKSEDFMVDDGMKWLNNDSRAMVARIQLLR